MLQRALFWLKAVSDLGQMWLLSRRPHIEEDLPGDLGEGVWIAIAARQPVQPGEPVYGTPAYKGVEAGGRFWIFVEEGSYWVYAVQRPDAQAALREFYANPDHAVLVAGGVVSAPGFRTEIK